MNVRNSKMTLKCLVAGAALALAAGCASNQKVEQAQSEAAEARSMVENLQSQVERLQSQVEEALADAEAAMDAAEASQQCCTDLERKLDRALQDMQQK